MLRIVTWFVGLSVCHDREPCKNGRTDWVLGCGFGWAQGTCIRWGPDPPTGTGSFEGRESPL